MSKLSPKYKDTYQLQHYNKEMKRTQEKRLNNVREYISKRKPNKKYDTHMNYLIEKIRLVYSEINKLKVNDKTISSAHASAVQHAIR